MGLWMNKNIAAKDFVEGKKIMNKKTLFSVFATIAISICLSGMVFSQGTTTRVTGVITDSSGAVVTGATVSLRREGTGSALSTQTADNGSYTFDLIQAGVYEVRVEKAGFKKVISTGNAAFVNQPTTVNVVMQAGDVSATVTVAGTAEQVQTASSGNIGNTVDQRTIESLPIIGTRGRNPLDLLNYQPGIVNGANTGGGVHVHGSRDRAFNFTLDGIDINESSAGGSNFTPLRPNPDSIQEFQIITTNFTAELGRSSGAQVTFITRSGTNQFHGNLFEYYQTPRFAASGYSNNLNGRAKDQFVQNIFGGSFGGPLFNPGFGEGTKAGLLRDKAFFFVNLQLLRAYDTALVTRTVYTQSARNGIYRYVSGNNPAGTAPLQNAVAGTATPSVTSSGAPVYGPCATPPVYPCMNSTNFAMNSAGLPFDPKTSAVLNAMPLPNNFSSVGDGLNTAGFDFGSPQHERQYDFVSKFDFKINNNNAFYIRYAQGNQNSFGDAGNGGRPVFPGTGDLVDTFRSPRNLAVNYRWSPSSSVTNEFLVGLNKFAFSFETPVPDPTFPFSFNLASTPNSNFTYNARRLRTWQFVDNVTWVNGNHILKGGINFRFGRQIDDRSSVAGTAIEPIVSLSAPSTTFGIYTIPSTATVGSPGLQSSDLGRLRSTISDFYGKIGSVSQAFVSDPNNPGAFLPAGSRWRFSAAYPEYDFYLQDSWRVRSNLVFDIGVRYEVKLSPTSDGRPILAPNQPFTVGSPATNTLSWVEKKLFKNDLNNFGPSIGVAWDPWKNGKTSIRANFRESFDRFPSQLFAANIFQNAPGNTTAASNTAFGSAGGLLRNIGPVIAGLVPTSTPTTLRTPGPFSTSTITLIDPAIKYPEIFSWVASFQREIWKDTIVEVNYIGKRGVHLFGGYDSNQVNLNATDSRCPGQTFLQAFIAVQNPANTQVCLAGYLVGGADSVANTTLFRSTAQFSTQLSAQQNAVASVAQILSQRTGAAGSSSPSLTANGFTPFFFQKFPQFTGAVNVLDSNDVSKYHGLEVIFKRRFTAGLGYQAGYTLSKSMDTRSFDPTFSTVSRNNFQSASSTPFDINNRRLNYAWSDFDRRHAFQATAVYELPFGKGKWFASDVNSAVDNIIGGWQVSTAMNLASGRPFTVYSGFLTFSNVVQSTGNCGGCARNVGRLVQENGTNYWFDPATRALFTSNPTAPGSNGSTGRNYFIAPYQFQIDASLSKKFKISERINFDLRVDARNLTNTPNFDIPTATVSAGTFGRIRDGVINTSRRIQFAGKISF